MKINIIILLTLFALLTSCEDYLEIYPKTQLSPENLYSSEKGLEFGANGAYNSLRNVTMFGKFNHWLLTEVTTDNMLTHSDKEYRQNLDKYLFTSSNDAILEQWINYYKTLGIANTFIENAEKSEINNIDLKNRVIGEVKFIRAYVYFMMVRLWGDVPLVTKEVKSTDDFFVSRTSKDLVYAQILEDLDFAASFLPESYSDDSDAGRITKGAAIALLSSVYLTQESFSLAASKASEVIASKVYSLYPEYINVFRPEGNYSDESIFQIQAITNYDNQGSQMGRYWSPKSNIAGHLGSDQYTASWDLYNSYALNDKRKESFVIVKNINASKDLPYTTKYVDPGALSSKLYGTSFHVIRYAEILLTLAEAENETNGPDALAYDAINQIRTRAGIEDLTPGLSKDEFRDSVWLERRKELYFEGQRWFDLIRTDRLKDVIEKIPSGVNANYYPIVELPKHLLFPLPAIETEINTKLLPNNTGY